MTTSVLYPIHTAPEGHAFLGWDKGICAVCVMEIVPPSEDIQERWFGLRKPRIVRYAGGPRIRMLVPYQDIYQQMALRADFGWYPTHWSPFPDELEYRDGPGSKVESLDEIEEGYEPQEGTWKGSMPPPPVTKDGPKPSNN